MNNYSKIIILNFWKTFMFVNFARFYFGMLYKRFTILKLCEGIFYIVKFILKLEDTNQKSSKVKTYDNSSLYFGTMMYMVNVMLWILMNFKS